MIGEWRQGLTWTEGHMEIKPLHDWSRKHAQPFYMSGTDKQIVPEFWTTWVHGGPFLWIKNNWIDFYIGFRPTAPDPPGTPIEPWPSWFAQFLKRRGMGNWGIALRRSK